VHFQWTGSNSNPDNNAGQGRQGTDRHNVVASKASNYWKPPVSLHNTDTYGNPGPVYGHLANSYPAKLSAWSFLGLTQADMQTLAILNPPQNGGQMEYLDDAGTYFDMGLRQCSANGVYNYLCTRNNNFSNRSQQAQIQVGGASTAELQIDGTASTFTIGGTTITTSASGSALVQGVTITSSPPASTPGFSQSGIDSASAVSCLSPFTTCGGQTITLSMKYTTNPMKSFTLVTAPTAAGPWTPVSGASYSNGVASAPITGGGCYTVKQSPNAGVIAGIVIACLVVVGLIVFAVWWFRFRGRGTNKI